LAASRTGWVVDRCQSATKRDAMTAFGRKRTVRLWMRGRKSCRSFMSPTNGRKRPKSVVRCRQPDPRKQPFVHAIANGCKRPIADIRNKRQEGACRGSQSAASARGLNEQAGGSIR
jgi:hypothetical protein